MTTTYHKKPRSRTSPPTHPRGIPAAFLETIDRRLEVAKALRARFDSLACDLGGLEEMSGIRASLLERFVFLEGILANIEKKLVTQPSAEGVGEDIQRWTAGVNTLVGLARTLGLNRVVRTVNLKTYIANKEATAS